MTARAAFVALGLSAAASVAALDYPMCGMALRDVEEAARNARMAVEHADLARSYLDTCRLYSNADCSSETAEHRRALLDVETYARELNTQMEHAAFICDAPAPRRQVKLPRPPGKR